MKQDQMKQLIQKSTVRTSEDFTDTLLSKIEAQESIESTPLPFPFKKIVIGFSIALALIPFLIYTTNHSIQGILSIDIKIPSMALSIMVTIAFLLGLNYILRLNETYKKLETMV